LVEKEHIKAAIQCGLHISAKSKEAARCLCKEARMEKVTQGEGIKDFPHPNLKISLLAAVQHKNRMFWHYWSYHFNAN